MGQQHMADGMNVFSLWLQIKWPNLWTYAREGQRYLWDPADKD